MWFSTSNTSPAATAGIGTPILHAAPGDVIGLRLMLTGGTEGLDAYGISVRFDDDGIDELDVQGAEEFGLAPTITCTPFPSCFFNTPQCGRDMLYCRLLTGNKLFNVRALYHVAQPQWLEFFVAASLQR